MNWQELRRLKEASSWYECFTIDAGWEKIVVYSFKGVFRAEDLKSLNGLITAGYSGEEDPGPCAVALSYLYRLEDEGPMGPPRIRNPGLHVRAISLGVRQISDMPLHNEFNIAYAVFRLEGEGELECKMLECREEDLYRVTSARVKNLFK